jgi:putative MATE family efflux protein
MNSLTNSISEKELKRRDFILHGNLWKVVFVIALPLFFYSLFNYAYSIIDTIMCSGLSKEALNAVGALNQANNMISAIGTGLGAGGSILIAREIGKGDYKKAKTWSSTVFFYVFIIAVATIAIVLPLTVPLLRLLNIAEESIQIGSTYFMISVCSSAVVMINTVYMGVEKAHGSTLPITLLNVGVVIIKVVLNVIFIYALQLKDMMYVSLATLIANSSLTIFILGRLFFTNYLFRFSFKDISFRGSTLKKVTLISFPIFLGKFIFSLGKVVINGFAKEFGSDVVGALGVSNNMGGAVTNPLSSIEDSSSSIISQNIGAKQYDRAIKTFYVGLVYNLSMALLGVILVTIFDKPITMFFARSAENVEEYAQHISQVFFYEKLGIITLAINSSVLGFLYGFGKTKIASLMNIARVFVFRIPSFLICNALLANGVKFPGVGEDNPGFMVAGVSMGVSNICIGLVAIVVIIVEITRLKKKLMIQEESMSLNEEEKSRVDSFIQQFLKGYHPYKDGTWCYEDGVVLNGAYQMYKATKDKFYLDFCVNYFDTHIQEDGSLKGFKIENYNLDDLEPGYALYLVNKIHHEDKYDKALKLMEGQFGVQIRLNNGAFIHKSRYPGQLWLDGLFMANPFYALYATGEHSLKMVEDIKNQFENVDKFNVDPESGQYRHCYDENKVMQWADKDTGRSPHVWLRSVGWLAMADCDVYQTVNESLVGKITAGFYKKQLKSVLDSLKPYEDEDTHMYYDLPLLKDAKGNYLESSGSIMFAYGYLKGSRLGMLPYEERKHGCEIFESIVRNCLKDKHLTNICKVSGLDNERRDGSVEYYLSEPVVNDDSKGVGPFMMAYSEYLAMPNM